MGSDQRHRQQSPDYVANPQWRSQPAIVKKPANSNLRRPKEWDQINFDNTCSAKTFSRTKVKRVRRSSPGEIAQGRRKSARGAA
jgi:hypothetical protein